jgi:hypothetical protein
LNADQCQAATGASVVSQVARTSASDIVTENT